MKRKLSCLLSWHLEAKEEEEIELKDKHIIDNSKYIGSMVLALKTS